MTEATPPSRAFQGLDYQALDSAQEPVDPTSPYPDSPATPAETHTLNGSDTQTSHVTELPPYTDVSPGIGLTDADLPWRPFYLRRRILFSFAAVFALLIVAIEVLLAVSNRDNGLISASYGQRYLWKYGPTAILILIAAVWSRTEYQSKLVAPWIRLSRPDTHPKHTLLLDYLSAFQLWVVFKALRNRDFTVSIASTVAIIIKALIVISTGLITLTWTKTWHGSWPLTIQDRFVNSNTRLSHAGSLVYYEMEGLIGRNLSYPNGIFDNYAFQSVGSGNLPGTAETLVTVDGFESSLKCEPAELVLRGSAPPDPHYGDQVMNLTVTSPGCSLQALKILPGPGWSCGRADSCNSVFARFALTQCDGTTGEEGKRVLVMSGNLTYTLDYSKPGKDYTGQGEKYPYITELHQSTQMLCVPTYRIAKVDVRRNGTQTLSVRAYDSDAAPRTLPSVTAWDVMHAHYAAFRNRISHATNPYGKAVRVADTNVDVDAYMELALPLEFAQGRSILVLFDPKSLEQLAINYYRQFSAIIAKQSLMEPTSETTQGFVVMWGDRLVIRTWAAQWMAGLAATCVLLTALAGFLVPRRGILPCSPTTLPGMALLVAHSRDLLAMLRFSGAADAKSLGKPLLTSTFRSGAVVDPVAGHRHFAILSEQRLLDRRASTFPQVSSKRTHPGVLHPASRLALCLLLAGVIVALEMTLRKSDHDNGLGDVGDDNYLHYTWTAIPAVAFGALSMTFSSMDFSIRSLAPYTALKKEVSVKTFMTLDFMDKSIPRTIFNEIKFANIGALAATSAFLVASIFTIFSASLFEPKVIPTTVPITLRVNQSFLQFPYATEDSNSVASLIFGSNFSYPEFTYGDLAFPQLVPTVSLPADGRFNASTVSIEVIVPALRSSLDCRIYDSSKIQTNLTLGYAIEFGSFENPLGLYIEGEECDRFPQYEQWKYNNILTTRSNMTYFAFGDATSNVNPVQGCSTFLYTWGKLDYTADPIVQHVAAIGCNETIETLSVSTHFTSTHLSIDTHRPPKPLENTARPSTVNTTRDSHFYPYLADLPTDPNYLQPFFAFLTTSPWAIPLPSLGDPSATESILAAIKHHHGIIQAQNLAAHLRPANSTNTTLTPQFLLDNVNATDDVPLYTGTATTPDGEGRRRVVQDRASTRVLQALLGCVLVLVAVGWACMRETDVLPRTPTTIASVVALLAGGNLFEQFGEGEGGKGEKAGWVWGVGGKGDGGGEKWELKGVRFWMGWGTVTDWEGREVGGGVNEGGVSRFGIFVLPGEGEKEEREGAAGLMGG